MSEDGDTLGANQAVNSTENLCVPRDWLHLLGKHECVDRCFNREAVTCQSLFY